MAKDPTNFRKRFKLYKEGKMPYENGLPKYEDGKDPIDQSRIDARELIELAVLLSQNSTFGKRNLSPESYYLRYRNSEGFRKRFDTGYGEEGAFYGLGLDLKKVPAIKYGDNEGSMYIPNQNLVYMGSNTNDDYAKLGLHNRDFVKAHEQAHSIYNDAIFGNNDSGMLGRPVELYMKLNTPNLSNYRSWVDKNNNYKVDFSHDSRGIEGGADIGALGYLLYNDGVFNRMDPKSKITTEQLDEWYKNYQLKNPNNPYLRPLENYGTEKAAWLLNNTASVLKKPTNGLLHAKNGKLPGYAEGTEEWLPDYTMDYILALENPTKLGLVNGIWRPPTDSSKWDINAIGGGLDIRYKNNPLVYNFLSDNNRLNNPYLTEQEEYDLRKRTFDDTMLPALIRMHDKYGELISRKGYARLAAMKWLGHPFLMAITPDSITGRAFLNAIESGDRDLDTVFNAYYRHPANEKKYAARIQSDENYWSNNRSVNLNKVPVQSALLPIVEKRDAVAVRKTIPKAKTRARWIGAENVSPYLTGKPILKLKKEIKPTGIVELHKESLWKAPMLFKNGKLPEYENGKTRNMKQESERDLMWYAKPFAWKYITNGLPIDTVRERLYNNLIPVSYRTNDKYPWTRARDAIVNNEKESLEKFDERQRAGALARDEIYAQYLHIPKNKRRGIGFELKDSKYKPTLNDKGEHYYSINFGEDEDKVRGAIINDVMKTSAVLDNGIDADGYSDFYNLPGLLPNQVKSSIVLNDLLGWHRVGRGIDPKKGDYVSYWDRWDLTPIGRTGEDQSMGIGTPVNIYDRIYLDDYYGVDSSAHPGTYYGGYLPEIEILPKHKDGKLPGYANGKIHIKPANRGKFTALKKRTGHSASWFKAHGTPAQKKMAVFALNSRKWSHKK